MGEPWAFSVKPAKLYQQAPRSERDPVKHYCVERLKKTSNVTLCTSCTYKYKHVPPHPHADAHIQKYMHEIPLEGVYLYQLYRLILLS